MSLNLLKQRRFLPYFLTQFLGAFNDNVYKNALIILVTYSLLSEQSGVVVNIAAGLFILPFFIFSSIAGQLADKFEKSILIKYIKTAEIIIMLLACLALYSESVVALLAIIFLTGTQSAFFGPIKYSILPQHLKPNELLNGNALVEAATFLAILIGTIIGGLLGASIDYKYYLMVSLVTFSVLGWLSSCSIPRANASQPNLKVSYNLWRSSLDILAMAKKNQPVYKAIIAISWFWFFGSLVLTQFPEFGKSVLYGDATVTTLLLATFTIGIALGSLFCAYLSAGRVEIGLMPIGAIGISLFTWLLSETTTPYSQELRSVSQLLMVDGSWKFLFYMVMIAFSAGLFIVPLYAFVQTRSDDDLRARMFAVTNIINSLFMVAAALFAITCLTLGITVSQIFLIAAILNALVTIYILTVVPEFFLRLVGWLLVNSIYRIRNKKVEHIPDTGAALLVCNHVSFVDALILNAVAPRPVHFVMIESIFNVPVVNKLFRWVKAIPIASKKDNPELVEQAFETIADVLESGGLVCIFPEGALTLDGEIAPFRPGVEKIIQRTPVPVVPLALRGLWNTWFSRKKGSPMRGWPHAFLKRIEVLSGEVITPETTTKELLEQKVKELRGEFR